MQREYEERTKQARDIMPELQGDADLSKELARVLAGMQALNRNDLGVSPQFLAQLQREILAPLRQFEIELSRRIGEIASRDKLHRISDDDIPPAFRKMVDEYFKRVAGKQ
jgi:hypothetical protein